MTTLTLNQVAERADDLVGRIDRRLAGATNTNIRALLGASSKTIATLLADRRASEARERQTTLTNLLAFAKYIKKSAKLGSATAEDMVQGYLCAVSLGEIAEPATNQTSRRMAPGVAAINK
nr:hypothetical protein [uncultured Dongia sp.]